MFAAVSHPPMAQTARIAPDADPGERLDQSYAELARANVPRCEGEWLLAERYLKLTVEERRRFKIKNARTRKIELTAYSVCFYASLREGISMHEAGQSCYFDLVALK